jgi:hypothetical protein
MKPGFLLAPVLALLAAAQETHATTYYVASNGSDTNDGISSAAPFQSLVKVSGLNLQPGDQVLFRRGDTFRGQLRLIRSGTAGNPIVLDGYGTGNPPVLSGSVPVTGWTPVGGNLWQATLPAAGAMVTGLYSNGVALPLGRWPSLMAANGGYLAADSASGQTQLVCSALSAAPTNNWAGAEVVCRTMQWVLDRALITSQTGNTLNFAFLYYSDYSVKPGWGFFIQNHIATLAQTGQWCYRSSSQALTLYSDSDPNTWQIEATQTGTVLYLQGSGGISNVVVQNLQVSGGLQNNIYAQSATNLTLVNVQIISAGQNGLMIDGAGGAVTITNCVFSHINNNAITLVGYYPGYAIRGCTFTDIATAAGRGLGGDNQMDALFQYSANATPGAPSIISDNFADGLGYMGFFFNQSAITIQRNVIRNFDLVKDDGGAIYTWNDLNPLPLTNQFILNNIVYNAVGASNGVANYYLGANGIYLDGHSRNVLVASNTVFNCTGNGLVLNNDLSNITVTANTVFNNGNQISINQRNYGDNITGNVFFCKTVSQTAAQIVNDVADVSSYGVLDGNYYCRPFDDALTIRFSLDWASIIDLPLSGWQALFGKDPHSMTSPITFPPYVTNSVGSNLIANGAFNASIIGWGAYGGASNNTSATWDNPGTLSGGCLKLSFSSPSGNLFNTLNGFDWQDIFPVTNGAVYLLSFDAVGSTPNRVLRTFLLQNSAPWHLVSAPARGVVAGTNRMHYQVFLPVVESIADARLQWQLYEGCDQPTVWIDNIQLCIANVTAVNADDVIRFEVNPTTNPMILPLASACMDVQGNLHSGNLTLPPYSSIVLMKTDPPILMSATQPVPQTISILWSGLPGSSYQVQTSSNLIQWSLQGWYPAAADGSFSVVDTNTSAPRRFYRASK